MKKLIILAISILVILVIGFVYFNFGSCKNLSEAECFNTRGCQGNYGSSECSGDICTSDISFRGCVAVPEKIIRQMASDKILCTETGGQWARESTKYNKYLVGQQACDCKDKKSGFARDGGCADIQSFCEKQGGVWEPSNQSQQTICIVDGEKITNKWTILGW